MGRHGPPDRRKVYVRIADELRQDIASGRYAAGESIPSIAKLGDRFGAAGATIERALAVLREEGIIMSRQGMPSVVLKTPGEGADETEGPSEEFTFLWSQLQQIKEQLRRQSARLDEIEQRTRNL